MGLSRGELSKSPLLCRCFQHSPRSALSADSRPAGCNRTPRATAGLQGAQLPSAAAAPQPDQPILQSESTKTSSRRDLAGTWNRARHTHGSWQPRSFFLLFKVTLMFVNWYFKLYFPTEDPQRQTGFRTLLSPSQNKPRDPPMPTCNDIYVFISRYLWDSWL